jgi:hypothetical protein
LQGSEYIPPLPIGRFVTPKKDIALLPSPPLLKTDPPEPLNTLSNLPPNTPLKSTIKATIKSIRSQILEALQFLHIHTQSNPIQFLARDYLLRTKTENKITHPQCQAVPAPVHRLATAAQDAPVPLAGYVVLFSRVLADFLRFMAECWQFASLEMD